MIQDLPFLSAIAPSISFLKVPWETTGETSAFADKGKPDSVSGVAEPVTV
ncbi:MAG: hypothetical protein GVY04_15275 [Cyanobacteria bacterium]|nr:hypothetical protein [Cyanobacteria bacterium GSL.Bin1]